MVTQGGRVLTTETFPVGIPLGVNFEDSLPPLGRARVDTFQVASINYLYCTKGRNRSYLLIEGSTSV